MLGFRAIVVKLLLAVSAQYTFGGVLFLGWVPFFIFGTADEEKCNTEKA
jgi:hypothetical protein